MAQLGKYYQEAFNKLNAGYITDFWKGFLVGQAEKVFMGVCPACMIAVDKEQQLLAKWIALDVCSVYEPFTISLELESRVEIWIAKKEQDLIDLQNYKYNNHFRGKLCGYADEIIDMDHVIDRPLK